MAADDRRAAKAFEDFTGRRAAHRRVAKLDDRNVNGWDMGPVVGVAYEAVRDGERKQYFHEFGKKVRPNLIARDDGRQLYIEGGRYKVTDHGIEDMPQLFVVNPSPRRSAGAKRRKSPMAARRRRRSSARRAAPLVVVRNPVRRRRRRAVARRSFARNPAPRRRAVRRTRTVRRYRRNPSARAGAMSIGKFLLPAAGIGAGAVGTEMLMAMIPIPASFKTGIMRNVTKATLGIAIGMLLGKVFRQKRLGNFFALGAVAIAVHDGLKDFIVGANPKIGFGQYLPGGPMRSSIGYYTPAMQTSFGGASTQRGDGTVDPDAYV